MQRDIWSARGVAALALAAGLTMPPIPASAEETAAGAAVVDSVSAVPEIKDVYVIQIRDHRFHPERLLVPAGRKIKLRVENLDETPEEFESYDFNREKIVKGGGKITVYVGPLKEGEYKFFGEFHPETAQGVLVAKPVPEKNKK